MAAFGIRFLQQQSTTLRVIRYSWGLITSWLLCSFGFDEVSVCVLKIFVWFSNFALNASSFQFLSCIMFINWFTKLLISIIVSKFMMSSFSLETMFLALSLFEKFPSRIFVNSLVTLIRSVYTSDSVRVWQFYLWNIPWGIVLP